MTSSVFFPELEERGVTLRKYLWEGPWEIFEMWGEPQDIVNVADEIGLLQHPEAEVLVSRWMARHEEAGLLREIDEEHLPRVPARFRVALKLAGGNPRERLFALLRSTRSGS